jgi:DNA-binding CsgD family transcriptional regulator
MAKLPAEQLTAGIERICRTTSGAVAIERAVAARLRAAVGFDAWCALTIDPASVLPTGGFHEEGVPHHRLPHLVEIEARGDDALSFPSLARASARVRTLSQATGGHPDRSQHYREVLTPSGLGYELRAMLKTSSGVWGALVLFRGSDTTDFSPAEAELVDQSTAGVAAAIRREMVLTEIGTREATHGPGLLLLDATLARVNATGGALRWLAEIDDGVDSARRLPYAVTTLAHRALANPAAPARGRTRTRTGRWLILHAERLADDPTHISVIIEPARPVEIAELMADAYGLTPRERGVVRALATGYSRSEIARMLGLSAHTVDDHIKRIFAKLDVCSRAELTAKLFFDQHAPRIAQNVPVGGTGWFIR